MENLAYKILSSSHKVIRRPLKLISGSVRCKSTKNASLPGPPVCLAYRTYEHEDKSGGPPVIVTHGLMGSKDNWHTICKRFSSLGRNMIAVDARNHGESPHTSEMDYFVMSHDIIDLMDEFMIDKACLLGHSMGGKASMVTALKHPDRVDSLIVLDVAPSISPRAKSLPAFLQCMLKIQVQLYEQQDIPLSSARMFAVKMLEEVEPNPIVRSFLASNLIQADNRFRWRVNLDSIINNFSYIADFPEFHSEQYNGPTLFIGGAESNYIGTSELPHIVRLFPKAKVHHIEGAGHWVHSDKPSAVIELVNSFLDECKESVID